MQTLFDPLTKLAALGAYARLVAASDGTKSVALSYSHKSTRKTQREAQVIAARFERLLVLQLDVGAGQQPRTVQQLLAANRIKIRDGRYVLVY